MARARAGLSVAIFPALGATPMQFTVDDKNWVSPNWEPRQGAAISMLVLHATAGSELSSLRWLTQASSKVSTHYLINKLGHIYELVPPDRSAWHAGRSSWRGRDSQAIQHQSIGIELVNTDTGADPYPPAQIEALTWLSRNLIAKYVIQPVDVVRHADIAVPRGRKVDPNGFPWENWKASLFTPPVATRRVVGVPVYQEQDLNGPLAGHLATGETVAIDKTYTNGAGHLASGLGFVDLNALGGVS